MNVVYLSYDGMTDPLGQSQVLPYLLGLSGKYSITLVSFEKKERLDYRQAVGNLIKAAGIEWVPLEYHRKPAIISTLYDLWSLWGTVRSIQKVKEIHILHCRSYITALIGLRLKRKSGVPFLFDMRGFWADERVEGGLWNLNELIYRRIYEKFKAWEKEFVKNANEIITLTEAGKKKIERWNLNNAITVIPCCVDEELFDPATIHEEQRQNLRKELGIKPDEFVLIYTGSLSTWYLFDEMMNFYSVLRTKIPSTRFLILTPEEVSFSKWSWSNEIVTRFVKRTSMPLYLSIANASVFFIKPSYSKKGSSATKMAELMAMNIPFVTNAGWGDVDEIVAKERGGLLLRNFDEFSIAEIINELRKGLEPARPFVRNYFSLRNGINLYSAVYSRLIK